VIRSYRVDRFNEVDDFQLNYRNELRLGQKHRLDFGLNVSSITMVNDVTIEDQLQRPTGDRRQSGNIYAFYLTDEFSITDALSIDIGFRHSITGLTNDNYFGERFGLRYQLSPSLSLKAANGRYNQLARQIVYDDPLSNLQDGWNLANDRMLGVLKSTHTIGGFNYSKNGFMLDVEYYRKNVTGLVEFTVSHVVSPGQLNDTQPSVTASTGKDEIRGVDIALQKKIGPYEGWLSYTFSKANNAYSQINNGQMLPSRLDQRHEAKFVHILDFPKYTFSATFLYGSGKPFFIPELNLVQDNNGEVVSYEILNLNKTVERLPTYHRLDLSAALKFERDNTRGEFGVSVLNLYNHENIQDRRLNINAIESAIRSGEVPDQFYRDIVLLDFTPSMFLNIFF